MNGLGKSIQRPARILMYTAYFAPEYSGAALQALTLARELRQRGHHIEFVTNRWPGLSDTTVVDGFAVQRLEPGRMHKHREFRLWFNLARYAWARRHDFDILHGHGAYFTNAFIGPLARLLGKRSLVKASMAKDDLLGMQRPIVGGIHRFMLRRLDACVGISQDLVREFREAGVDPSMILAVPNGVDTLRFRPAISTQQFDIRRELGLSADQPIALYVGVLDQRKNIQWLAEQWVAQQAFGTGALLLAVGPQGRDDSGGALRARLAELARQHPRHFALRDFHGDVTTFYQSSDLLVLPSLNEGLPNVVLEAMASGLPVVATTHGGIPEAVEHGISGLLTPERDAPALAQSLLTLAHDPARYAAMSAAAASRVRAAFALPAQARALEAIYREALAR